MFTCALPADAAPALGLGLAPTTVEVTAEPGDRFRQLVIVRNVHTDRRLSLTVGLADWTLDENGKLVLGAPGSSPRSASDWMRFSPSVISLEPGERRQVRVDVEIPADALKSGDYRSAVLVSTVLPGRGGRVGDKGVWTRYQVASLFYLTLPPAAAEPEVTEAEVVWREREAPVVQLEVANHGSQHARLKGTLRVQDGNGTTLSELPVQEVVLDGQTRRMQLAVGPIWQQLAPGAYPIEVALETESGPVPFALSAGVPVLRIPIQAAANP